MYNNNEVIRYLQANKILALKFEHALAGVALTVAGLYGVVQKAADSAERLRITCPAFFSALYAQEIERMYFLVEPLFIRSEAFKAQWASDAEMANIIEKIIREHDVIY